mgnify:CR=1 FL=1
MLSPRPGSLKDDSPKLTPYFSSEQAKVAGTMIPAKVLPPSMTLPTGTALHHGHYVIDAFSAEDAIGPIYLATHIPRGRWVQLRILGSRHPESIPFPEQRQAFYHYLGSVRDLHHPLFSGQISGFEDSGVCYQVMEANLGHPLGRFVSADHPISPRQSLTWVRQVAQGLLTLKPLGWQGLTLTPDQFWQRPQETTLTFTGFDFPSFEPMAEAHQEARLVKGLSYLLYFLLTGQRAEQTQAPLAVDVRNRLPGLPYELDTALQLGSRQDENRPSITLTQWMEMLPDLEPLQSASRGPEPAKSGEGYAPMTDAKALSHGSKSLSTPARAAARQTVMAAVVQAPPSSSRKWATAALICTVLVASCGGLGLGLTARMQPAQSNRSIRLNPEQSFPPLSDWSGDDPVDSWEVSPIRRSLPDYGDRPARPRNVPEQVAQPSSPFVEDDTSFSASDTPLSDTEYGVADPLPGQDDFFDQQESFTTEPEVAPRLQSPEPLPEWEPNSAVEDSPAADPPAPLPLTPAPPESLTEPPPPLTAPAPLPAPSPSAPAPSTS